ncbi:MAG: GNAT family N-acetyltransferase [Mycobacteriales bacterium]
MRPIISEYDPEWPRAFEAEKQSLERVLAPWLDGGIHHIGSTSIPGIAAKPSLDMMAGVRSLLEAREAIPPLATLGYVHDVHRQDAVWFHKSSADPDAYYTHGLHLTVPGSDLWHERLVFRDALRADASLAREYELLKRRLADEFRYAAGYGEGKRSFVARVLADCGSQLRTTPRIRCAMMADAARIAEFQTTCWREAYAGLVPDEYLQRVTAADREVRWRNRLSGERNAAVAELDGEIVGIASWSATSDVPPLELKSLYVGAALRGSGLGALLLDAALGQAAAFLWVFTDNPRAQAFYRRHGFLPDGEQMTDPGTGLAETRMVRTPQCPP